jgi:hypothetical protein
MQREASQAGATCQRKRKDDSFLEEKLKERGEGKDKVFILSTSTYKRK